MEEIKSVYEHKDVEKDIYSFWLENNFFKSIPDNREPYVIVIPPPNVTGVLHMGHVLNNTIQDILIRRARMQGKNACWVPGTDHASIATEAKVVAYLKEKGIDKRKISREEFLKYAWDWSKKHENIIIEQLKRLGASCDWDRLCFTMDDIRSESVLKVFVDLFRKGYIYRGERLINWDPEARTAISDEEVIYKEQTIELYYVKYYIHNSNDYLVIATTRPETILADTAICVHPKDERYKKYHNKKAIVPLVERIVPIITDEYVDMEFGTGVLKITPAHDFNDYEIGIKHNLEIINIFNEDATLNSNAVFFVGQNRFKARELILNELKKRDLLVKIETYNTKIGFSERTDVIIEPRISKQWFLKMKPLVEPALKSVLNDEIKLIPPKFKNVYKHWMENVKDWCISRQLWWGHRIPAWYLKNDENVFFVAETEAEVLKEAKEKYPNITLNDLKQDEDVLDTWFSSWLWPISVFDGIRNPNNPEIKYYYPTNDLVTAPEILFFWVARMIMAGYEYLKEKPFKNVYLTGIVRDKIGRKMSKSLGNSPEPMDLINKYSADGVRFGIMVSSPAGNDLLFDESLCEQGRNFANKIWNAFRFIYYLKPNEQVIQPTHSKIATDWIVNLINKLKNNIEEDYNKFRLHEVVLEIYKVFWEDFCSWYLEIIKPINTKVIDTNTYTVTIKSFETLLKLLHPIMPFITEKIWKTLYAKSEKDSIMFSNYPMPENYDDSCILKMNDIKQIITNIRKFKKDNNLANNKPVDLYINFNKKEYPLIDYLHVVSKLTTLGNVYFDKPKVFSYAFIIGNIEYFIYDKEHKNIEKEAEKIKKEIEHYKNYLKTIEEKLNNKDFLQKAPKNIVEYEKKKYNDILTKLNMLQETLNEIEKNKSK